MGGNAFGTLFRVTTWGESHGAAIGAVIDGCPPGIGLSKEEIQRELDRRRPGGTLGASPRQERDRVEILSGLFEGRTTGTPLCLIVRNEDVDSSSYEEWKDLFRPGHADFTYHAKYGVRDYRGGGRASARETVARVAAGAVARAVLTTENIDILGYTLELGGIRTQKVDLDEARRNAFYCPDAEAARAMERRVEEARLQGDTLGGIMEILVRGCPPGLGEPVFDKLDADLAKALMSVGAVKAVEVGAGFRVARMLGSQCNDPIGPQGFEKNDAGGILGGISNGEDIVLRVAVKPIPSIPQEQKTVDRFGRPALIRIQGRHDTSAIPRIIPVCEAMVALVVVDHLLRQRALGGR